MFLRSKLRDAPADPPSGSLSRPAPDHRHRPGTDQAWFSHRTPNLRARRGSTTDGARLAPARTHSERGAHRVRKSPYNAGHHIKTVPLHGPHRARQQGDSGPPAAQCAPRGPGVTPDDPRPLEGMCTDPGLPPTVGDVTRRWSGAITIAAVPLAAIVVPGRGRAPDRGKADGERLAGLPSTGDCPWIADPWLRFTNPAPQIDERSSTTRPPPSASQRADRV
jgi:hypothetical protein